MEFFKHSLANGLELIGEKRPGAASTALGFFVKTGARDETPEVSGVSHFLEHMMFKGTARRSALDITYQLSAVGAQSNAFTSEENTVYYAAFLPEYLSEVFDILSDMIRPALDPQEFATEKKVILEEIEMYKDMPTRVLFEKAQREFFSSHPAGNSVLGTTESISALSVEQMRNYFESRYSASNIVLTISGEFDWKVVCELADKACSGWNSGNILRDRRPNIPTPSRHILTKDRLQSAHLAMVSPGPAASDEVRFAARVLSMILGDSTGSKVYWQLIDKGLADSATIDCEEMDATGFVYAFASCAPAEIDRVEDILRNILAQAADFTAGELERAKTKLRTSLVLKGESSMRRLMSVGLDWINRRQYQSLEEESEAINGVTRAAIDNLLAKFSFQPVTVVRMLPQ